MSKRYKFLNVKQKNVLEKLIDWLKFSISFLKREIIWLDRVPKGARRFPDVLEVLGISKQKFDQYFQKLNIKSIPALVTEVNISLEEISMITNQSNSYSEAFVKIWERRRKFVTVEEAVATLILFDTVFEYESDERKDSERARKIFEKIVFPSRIVDIEEEPKKPSPQQERFYIS